MTEIQKNDLEKAVDIVVASGGKIVGRTRLQKTACLLELAGVGDGFQFEYHRFGPFSDELATAIRSADLFGLLTEEKGQASWGGTYSTYSTAKKAEDNHRNSVRNNLAKIAVEADPIELELAVTAAYLASLDELNPWEETAVRKPKKAENGRLEKAIELYRKFKSIEFQTALPDLASTT